VSSSAERAVHPRGTLVPTLDSEADWVRRYLAVLGVEPAPPDLPFLRRLVRAHIQNIQFENASSILRRAASPSGSVPPLDRDAMLDRWETRRGGGVCFELADMCGMLLRALGYAADNVLGLITFPGSHQAVLVTLDDVRYLVDVGNGAPLFEPIALVGAPEIQQFGLRYRIRASADEPDNVWIQERWQDGGWRQFCRYDLRPSIESARAEAYQRHHVRGQSWVVDLPRLIRCMPDGVLVWVPHQLTRYTASAKYTEALSSPDAIRTLFGLPNLPLQEALTAAL
jgi:arylamine N-acetyltransferase